MWMTFLRCSGGEKGDRGTEAARHAFKPFISKWGHVVVTMCYYTWNVNNNVDGHNWTNPSVEYYQYLSKDLMSSQFIQNWMHAHNYEAYLNHTKTLIISGVGKVKESSELHFINSSSHSGTWGPWKPSACLFPDDVRVCCQGIHETCVGTACSCWELWAFHPPPHPTRIR